MPAVAPNTRSRSCVTVLAPMKKVRNARPSARTAPARAGAGIDHGDAVRGGGPDAADRVRLQRHDGAAGQAGAGDAARSKVGSPSASRPVMTQMPPPWVPTHRRPRRSMASELMMASDSASAGPVGLDLFHLAAVRVEPVQAVAGADPQRAVVVGGSVDAVVGQAAAFLRPCT
jgi:hypothetical protein